MPLYIENNLCTCLLDQLFLSSGLGMTCFHISFMDWEVVDETGAGPGDSTWVLICWKDVQYGWWFTSSATNARLQEYSSFILCNHECGFNGILHFFQEGFETFLKSFPHCSSSWLQKQLLQYLRRQFLHGLRACCHTHLSWLGVSIMLSHKRVRSVAWVLCYDYLGMVE